MMFSSLVRSLQDRLFELLLWLTLLFPYARFITILSNLIPISVASSIDIVSNCLTAWLTAIVSSSGSIANCCPQRTMPLITDSCWSINRISPVMLFVGALYSIGVVADGLLVADWRNHHLSSTWVIVAIVCMEHPPLSRSLRSWLRVLYRRSSLFFSSGWCLYPLAASLRPAPWRGPLGRWLSIIPRLLARLFRLRDRPTRANSQGP